jgi:hydroxymethylbilane synthase
MPDPPSSVRGRMRIATRRSRLALWQANHVAGLLTRAHPGLAVDLVAMTTQGDKVRDRPLADVGGKGLFVKELERAIADGRADIAVHSMKDVPSEMPAGMAIAGVLPRADPRDALVSLRYRRLDDLPANARIGTSSPRRQAQLKNLRPDLAVVPLRGNVDTRLSRLDEGTLDGILLACAGLDRLGLSARISEVLEPEVLVPAVGQGVIGIECAADDAASRATVAALNDASTASRLAAERAFAERLHGSCHSPIAAHAAIRGETLALSGFVGSPDGREAYRDRVSGSVSEAAALGLALAERILDAGAGSLLDRLRRPPDAT